jgi:hypothetical protein
LNADLNSDPVVILEGHAYLRLILSYTAGDYDPAV